MSTSNQVDLSTMAHDAMVEAGFQPDLTPEIQAQLNNLKSTPPLGGDNTRDLRKLLWSSIDNRESKDLDQIEWSEQLPDGKMRILIGIADVDAYVPKDSPVDQHAKINTTSVYMGIMTYPMLPEKLSFDISSLLPNVDRLAIVTELIVDENGTVVSTDFYRALVRNHAKLAYADIGPWLDSKDDLPDKLDQPGLVEQLRMQEKGSDWLHDVRVRNGALNLSTVEATPVAKDGKVVDITTTDHNSARDLIENLMVAANTAMAIELDKKGTYSIRRIVREPKRWPKIVETATSLGDTLPEKPDSKALSEFLARRKAADPDHFPDLSLTIVKLLGPGEYVVVKSGEAHEGHFGLAVQDYTHSTAPNRRYPDIVTQRLLKSVIDGKPETYSQAELEDIAAHCTLMASAANKVERFVRKAAAAVLLSDKIGQNFRGIVTGVKEDGVFVRISKPSAEGRIIKNQQGIDVGDKVKVRLLSTNPAKGFIDFQKL
ncbi:MAG: RNB domain-containing ribonuclease [Cyanobacteria bacterium SZAS-4]|nr:RNB domain-containing ribonuclease [Cyanobacteria bacterium SZAS-4]